MKAKKIAITALSLSLCATPAFADTIFGIYAGAGTWKQEYAGDVRSGLTTVDVEDDLAVDGDNNNVFYVAVEHPLPFLPNIRAQHMTMDVTGDNVLSRTIEFNGELFALSDAVATTVDLSQTDAVFYYELLDNVVSLDLGVAVSLLEGELAIASATESASAEFDEVIPMLYGKVRADLPFTGFWVAAEGQGMSYEGNSLMEFNAHVGYESDFGFGLEAGYRSVQLELDQFEDVQAAEIDITGPYAALNFHF